MVKTKIQERTVSCLTSPEHLKSLLCRFDFHLQTTSHVHDVGLIASFLQEIVDVVVVDFYIGDEAAVAAVIIHAI